MSNIPIRPEKQPPQAGPTRGVGNVSKIATQVGSNGPILPESFFSFSGFIFLITGAFLGASFENWSVKRQLKDYLAQTLTDSMTVSKSPDKETMHSTLESELSLLSIDQLRTLDQLLKNHPDTTIMIISQVAKTDLPGLQKWLVKLTSFEGQRIVGIKEDIAISIKGLGDTHVSNGVSTRGILYEIHYPTTHAEMKEFEFIVTDPKTGASRSTVISLKIDERDFPALESAFRMPLVPSEYKDRALDAYLTLSKPAETSQIQAQDPKSDAQVKHAQKILQDPTIQQRNPLMVTIVHKDKSLELPIHITSRTVLLNDQKYLELKLLNYTTRIPYNKDELKGVLIERIGTDGTLANAIQRAASAFTRGIAS